MPPSFRFLAASSQAARLAKKSITEKPLLLTNRLPVASLENRISTEEVYSWYLTTEKSKGVIQALADGARKSSYIQALAEQGLSAESACRMESRFSAPS